LQVSVRILLKWVELDRENDAAPQSISGIL
jgi:hypothetical protein